MSKQIVALAGATLLALAGVAAFVYMSSSAETERLVMVGAFLAPTITALLAIARVQELNGEVTSLKRTVTQAAELTATAAETVDEATRRVERSR
jgi:hypothetical protein